MFVVQQLDALAVPLINKFYGQFSVRGRATKQDQCWVIRAPDIIAACRIQKREDAMFLSTVFVHPNHRGQGVAAHLISNATASQSKPIYTFAYRHLVGFYTQLGFQLVSSLPHDLSVSFANYVKQKRDIVAMCLER